MGDHAVDITSFVLREHEQFPIELLEVVKETGMIFVETPYEGVPVRLGLLPTLQASYFIGVDWLDDAHAITVLPNVENLDFLKMWNAALRFSPSSEYLGKFYGIGFDKPKIRIEARYDMLSPLLILHFLKSMETLVGHQLRKGYVAQQDNLHMKVKGRVLIGKQIRKNVMRQKATDNWCEYSVFCDDIQENRILKKALILSERYLNATRSLYTHSSGLLMRAELKKCLTVFSGVSELEDNRILSYRRLGKLYRDYDEPLRLARLLIRRLDFSAESGGKYLDVFPFWIDMSRLFEVYVYEQLTKAYGKSILFQVEGYGSTAVDFVKKDEKLIIDTKYKPSYIDESDTSAIIHDVRQLSGYARDKRILKAMEVEDESVLPCVIIYPDADNRDDIAGELPLLKRCSPVKGFRDIWKMPVRVPLVKATN